MLAPTQCPASSGVATVSNHHGPLTRVNAVRWRKIAKTVFWARNGRPKQSNSFK